MSIISRAKFSGRIRLSALYVAASPQRFNSYSTYRNPTKFQQSSSSSERIDKPTGDAIVWPKPIEIPYQAKVANFVNLIGCIKAPVQFKTVPEGKHFAATIISQEVSGGKDSLLVPVVFKGDLAHVVAFHVKENDCVLVSGQLSSAPTHFTLSSRFHVVAETLNFVKGFKREKKSGGGIGNVVDKELEDAKLKKLSDWGSSNFNLESKAGSGGAIDEGKAVNEESGMKKKKNGVGSLDLWRDIVKNPGEWWDYRDHKAKGIVKEKYPDFKHKETGEALWADSAPKWVLQGLGRLEFDVETRRTNNDDDSWKDLVENPSKWWDNRTNKRNPKGPDFKHKETGKGLWVSRSPSWASTRLPQLKPVES